MTDDRAKVILLIKKLLNMAEHEASNEHEALVAATQAEKLMRKYNIQYAEAIAAEIKTGASIVTKSCIATAKDNGTATKQTPTWAQQIAVRVGELFDSPVRLSYVKTAKGYESAIVFHGYVHDVEVAAWTFDVLISTVNRVCKAYRKDPHYLRFGRTVMNAYRMGVVDSICFSIGKLVDEKEAAEAEVEAQKAIAAASEAGTLSSGTSLVFVKRKAIEDKFGEFKYREAKAPKIKNAQAYHTGRVDGRKIEIQSAITPGTANAKRLNS